MLGRWLVPPVILGFAFIGGCGPSLEDITAPHEEEGRAQIERLERVLDHCRELEPISEDSPPEVEGVVFADYFDRPNGNARTLWLDAYDGSEDYADPIKSGYTSESNWWHNTAAALSDDPPDFSERHFKELDAEFEFLNETEYALVIKTKEYSAPKVDEDPPYESDNTFYNLGAMSGEAHLYRLEDGEHLGAVLIVAVGQTIGVGMIDFAISSDDPEENILSLKQRLFGNVHEFAEATLAKRAKGIDSLFELEENAFLADRVTKRSAGDKED